MASTAITSAGSTFSVCATLPATYDLTGFGALTFVPIAEVTDIGTYGKKYNLVKHMPIGTRQTIKRRGSYDNGTIVLKLAKASGGDAGQTLMKAALGSDTSYAFRVVLQDGTTHYFSAQTLSFVQNVGGVDTITSFDASLELDNDIIGY